ncbi:fasciclin domain-containing protein [Algoriphagus sp. AK58]|uniref:fasciclin domain-containing protein n=1 Tax=Algoriphagus sp. AK58 TaxID=1406877 RepID=UPI0016504620|nr:fasciclin domain-containing protein [Algoriphagus sp. AK58]MBC6367959.1 hypothetical protein [Algoriphagus sp. AK58]
MTTSINRFIKGGMYLFLALIIVSCSEIGEQTDPVTQSNLKSIPEVLKTLEQGDAGQDVNARRSAGATYATFNAALGKSGLASVFSRNDLTVFAPTDAAFAALGLNPGNIGSVEGLTNILLYHVVAGSVFSTDLTAGFVPTLNGAAVKISLMGGAKVNEANIVMVDKQARNGVIHGIDRVLLPPAENIMQLVDGNQDFSILKTAIDAAGLREALATTNDLTVFAPTNQAFFNLLEELGYDSLGKLVGAIGTDGLISVLKYHVFAGGRIYSSDLSNGDITMFSEDKVTVDVSGPKLIDLGGRESMIIGTDVQATNGVVHVIDTVILNL